MKKYATVIALGLAILFGVVAVILANKWLSSQTAQDTVMVQERVPLTKIVVAAQDLEIGAPLSKENLTLAEWPKSSVPKGAFNNVAEVEGRVAVTKLAAGRPLLAAELAAPGSGVGLVALIPNGKRAMSIRVDEVIGVAGFILPNTYVDIIAVGSQTGGTMKAKTILKRIKVLAIAQETFTEEGKAKVVRTVTLELSPREAEQLALQTHEGGIHLVLRNPLDEAEETAKEEKPKVAKKSGVTTLRPRVYTPRPAPHDVEIIRGTSREKIRFKNVESEDRI